MTGRRARAATTCAAATARGLLAPGRASREPEFRPADGRGREATRRIGRVACTLMLVAFLAGCGRAPQVHRADLRAARNATVRGVALDDIAGRPIAGALVVVSESTVIAGPTAPPAKSPPWPSATTGPDGAFAVENVPPSTWTMDFTFIAAGYPKYRNAQWVQIFSTGGRAAYHGIWTIATKGTTDLGNIAIARPSAADVKWLASVNADRTKVGVPAVATPLAFDSVTLQGAQYWAKQMASAGFFAHACPAGDASCESLWLWQTQHHSMPSSQNIAGGYSSQRGAEAAFMSEIVNCPSGGNWRTCRSAANTGHYINIMSATDWAGVATAVGKDPNTRSGSTTAYYVENFAAPSAAAANLQSLRQPLGISASR